MKKILIVEDDPFIARVYATKYAAAGFETSIATDGEEGLALLNTFKPDLVHLDLFVPKVNGLEIVKLIRSQPELSSLPIVVLSNTYQNHLAKAAMAAGATELVSKATCTPKMMLEIVEKLRSRMRTRAEAPQSPPAEAPVGASTEAPVAASGAATPEAAPVSQPSPPTAIDLRSWADIEADKHAGFHADIRQDFLGRAPEMLTAIRERIQPLLRAESESARIAELTEISRTVHSFEGHAAVAGFEELSRIASALFALLTEILEGPEKLTDSSLRTIVDACDFLPELLGTSTEASPEAAPPLVLVVDDDAVSRKAMCLALARLKAATVSVDDPQIALRLLGENSFSLILLDVAMPVVNGFELCKQLRALPKNAATPVIFVTTLASDEDREMAQACGGNDLIAKPFLPMELAVKALSLLRRGPL